MQGDPMKFAYADPPYLGCCKLYGHDHRGIPNPVQARFEPVCWDELGAHRDLIAGLSTHYPDGWAMSASSVSLRSVLPLCPPDIRIAAWVKPFAAFKRNVRNAYTWEPVLIYGGRRSSKDGAPVTRDHLTTEEPEAIRESITMKKGLTGAKPAAVNEWILKMLGFKPGDTLIDLFPGTGGMSLAVRKIGGNTHD